jgi:uncharacterized Ntn-hydrolase superfamily protein
LALVDALSRERTVTYSIVARDPDADLMGVATQSHAFAVGSSVPWAEPGYGLIATQSVAEPFYGELGLSLMRGGLTAQEALDALTSIDPHPARRQLAMVDSVGGIAVYTGDSCIPDAGHLVGRDCCALANMAASEAVWTAMVERFEATTDLLPYRLLAALDAAEEGGGDVRGQRSAAIIVVRTDRTGRPWHDRVVDLRVDRHPEAVSELRRLGEFSENYHRAVRGFEQALDGAPDEGLELFGRIRAEMLEEPDHLMWMGLAQVAADRIDDATETFERLRTVAPGFMPLLRRFPESGFLADHADALERALPED